MVDLSALISEFRARHDQVPEVFSAPGRVNLIGEHTDYNDGFVLPLAIERRTYVLGAARADTRVVARSANLDAEFDFDLASPGQPRRGMWGDYVEGMARALQADGHQLTGANLLIASDVAAGAGLSASAALELAIGLALSALSGNPAPDGLKLARAGQQAEHQYVGTLCGIMDQYVSALAEPEHALLIDCRSLTSERVPLTLDDAVVVICDTQVKHALASSAYNERRAECAEAVRILATVDPSIRALRDVSHELLQANRELLSEKVFRRCRHVVLENARTLRTAEALRAQDLGEVGALMTASHHSLRDDYEVSCKELNLAVEVALSTSGVYGARMTGGGFGGCTVTLCKRDCVVELEGRISDSFGRTFGTRPDVFTTRAAGGARIERS